MNKYYFFIILIIFIIMKNRSTVSLEDKVQRNNSIINKFWYVIIEYNDKNKFYDLINNLDNKLEKFKDWYFYIYGIKFKYIISDISKRDKININDTYCVILYDKNNLHINYYFNHNKIGGHTIVYLVEVLTLSNKETTISERKLTSIFNMPYFLYEKPYYYKSLINHNIIDTRRYYFNIKTTIEGSQYEILYELALIMYNIFCKKINKKVDFIVFYICRAFKNKKNSSFNNLGVIWVKFNPNKITSWHHLKTYIKNNKYQKYITNLYINSGLAGLNDSKNTRSLVDFNISNNYIVNSPINRINTSYITKGTFYTPNYIALISNYKDDHIDSSITITTNSDKFEPLKYMKELNNVDMMFKKNLKT